MSRTLIVADGKVTDENGLIPPPGETDNGLWYVLLVQPDNCLSYWFRPRKEVDWVGQPQLSNYHPLHQPPPVYVPTVVGTDPTGNWVTLSDQERICLGDTATLEPNNLEPAHSRVGKE